MSAISARKVMDLKLRAGLFILLLAADGAFAADPPKGADAAPKTAPKTTKESQATIYGTEKGMMSPEPSWSAGLQLGTFGSSGLTMQKLGFHGGALDLALGVGNGIQVSGDFLFLLGSNLQLVPVANGMGYRYRRAEIIPFSGLGLQIDDNGIAGRVPIGMQYTLAKDPVLPFGHVTLLVGNIHNDDDIDVGVNITLGVRLLL